ncbi:MAG: radical SAM family heme chaperone HemW [Gammaproteobacteria bacterium]|nr:radical SAM family heme chaperone HemW [Gammaproteobacteria bacterium]
MEIPRCARDDAAALYIHMPWCIKKCPYCDFNSHVSHNPIPEAAYINRLIHDLKTDINHFGAKAISSIFIGGGTPSLFSAESYQQLFSQLRDLLPFTSPNIEITLEANPGSVEQKRFEGYLKAGINRLSLGIQSFDAPTLKQLGRIHNEIEALQAIQTAKSLGFNNFNIDLMYASPRQSVELALSDLNTALACQPTHLSWYQFTLEPNTYFYRYPPPLPHEDHIAEMEQSCFSLLKAHDFQRYEISAFTKENQPCQHNLNYWTFGDYYGIGAGAHGKLTSPESGDIIRTQKHRLPKSYLDSAQPCLIDQKTLSVQEKCFEFILNTSRLETPIPLTLFTERTGLAVQTLDVFFKQACQRGFISLTETAWSVTPLGRLFTNDLQMLALE